MIRKLIFTHIAVLKFWHLITIAPPGRIVSFCVASHVPLRNTTPSTQSCFVMMQRTETSSCLMGLVTWLQPDPVHRGYWGVENPGSKPEACSCLVGFLTVLHQYDLVPLGFCTRHRLFKLLAVMFMVYSWFEVVQCCWWRWSSSRIMPCQFVIGCGGLRRGMRQRPTPKCR